MKSLQRKILPSTFSIQNRTPIHCQQLEVMLQYRLKVARRESFQVHLQ